MACSNCVLTLGFDQACDFKSIGGYQTTLYIIPRCLVTAITYADAENSLITAIARGTEEFFRVAAIRDSITTTETQERSDRPVIQSFNFAIRKVGTGATRAEAAANAHEFARKLSNTIDSVLLVAVSRDGVGYAFGVNAGMEVATGTQATSGAAKTDESSFAFVLEAAEDTYAVPLDATLLAAIEAAAVIV